MNLKLIFFTLFSLHLYNYSQSKVDTDYIKTTLTDSLYAGNVNLDEHLRGKWYSRTSEYLEQNKYEISNFKFNENTIGDFNNNKLIDIFGTIQIKRRHRDETYLCLFELNENKVSVYNYFEMGVYNQLFINNYKNDTLSLRTLQTGREGQTYIDRLVSIIHDEKEILKVVSPNTFSEMKNTNIFKDSIKNIKREVFIDNLVIKTQEEAYTHDNILITSELKGFNDLLLRFTINNNNLDKDFDKTKFVFEMIEFLQSTTRFPSIITKIERKILEKKEDNISVSDAMNYEIKNYLDAKTYFIIGEYESSNAYLFDIIYVEE